MLGAQPGDPSMSLRRTLGPLLAVLVVSTVARADESPHWGPDRSVDLLDLIVDLAIDVEAGRIEGTTSLLVRGLRAETAEARFDAVDMEIAEVRVDGRPAGHRHDGEVLSVSFEPPLAGDARALVEVDYAAEPEAGLFFVRPDRRHPDKQLQCWSQGETEDNRRWFPAIDHPSERCTSETRIRVAKPLKVVGNGPLVEVEDHGDGTWTWRHRLDFEHVPYLVSLAIGDWATTTEDWEGVRLEYHVPKALAQHAPRSFSRTAPILAFLSEETGLKYPWPVYRQTCVDEYLFGGMENITATTLNLSTLHDERAHLDWSSDGLVAHEAAHQWFGDYVTCRNWSDAWLNEGFATYYAALAERALNGEEFFVVDMDGKRKSAIGADAGDKRRPIVSREWVEPFDLFDGHAYAKGAMVLHALRRELGDADYRRAIAHYLDACGGRSVTTHDLITAVEDATGRELSAFFDQWVFGAGQPELEVSWSGEEGAVEITVRQAQERSELVGLFDVPLDLMILGEGWSEERAVRLDGEAESFHFELPGEPVAVLVDPDGWLLRKLDIDRPVRETAWVLRNAPRLLPRLEAARELKEKAGGRRAAAALIEALGDLEEHRSVRVAAAESLGAGRGAATRDALLAALKQDPESRVRTAAASALGDFEHREVGAALRRALWRDESYRTRAAAARSLGKVGGDAAAAELERALTQRSHRDEVVKGALDGLMELEAPRLARLAEGWTDAARPPEARDHAIGVLVKLAQDSEDEPLRERVVDRLVELLDDPLIRTRAKAIGGLGDLKVAKVRSTLSALAESSAVSRIRRSARSALEKLDAPAPAGKGPDCERCDELEERIRVVEERLDAAELE